MKHPFLKIVLPLFTFYVGIQVYYFLVYTPPNYVLPLTWDKFGYYLYLPSTFIYHDILHLGFIEGLMKKYELSGYFYQAHIYSNGNYVLSYTLGLALLELPFFFLGDLISHIMGYPADGFSVPYQFCITLCGTFYSMIGIWLTYRNLRFFFKNSVALVMLAILILCTNYFYYSAFENGMTHTYLFTMYAATLYCTIRWHQGPKLRYAVWLGVAIGLAIVMRPSEILIILIPLLWNIKDVKSLQGKTALVFKHFTHIVFLGMVVIAIGLLQLAYWKYSSGHWLYNSYKETGQFFDFIHPNLLRGVFSLRKGWLVYSPVMVLSFFGLYFLYRNSRQNFLSVATYMFINIYVVFSWCQWDYGGGFGSRPLVQSYAVLVLPIGFAIDYFFSRLALRYLVIIFLIACSALNLMQTTQYAKGLLSPGGLGPYTYHLLFGKFSVNADDIKRFEKLEVLSGPLTYADTIKVITFDTLTVNADTSHSPTKSLILTKDTFMLYNGPVNPQKGDYIGVYAKGRFDHIEYNYNKLSAMRLVFLGKNSNEISERYIKIEPLMNGNATKLNVDYLGDPETWTDFDFAVRRPSGCAGIQLMVFNPGGNQTLINYVVIKNIVK